MIKKFSLTLLSVSLLSSVLCAQVDKAKIDTYMDVSGTNIMIGSMSDQITAGISQTSMMYGESVDKEKVYFLQKLFDADNGEEIVTHYLSTHFSNKNLSKIIGYYNSPIGKKVTQAGIDAFSPSAQADMYHFMADLQTNSPAPERIAVIKLFIQELHMVENMENIYSSLIAYMNMQASNDKKLPDSKIAEIETMMHQAFEKQMFLSAMFIYRDISNEELKKVIQFYQTPAGEAERIIVTDAMSEMLKEGFLKALQQ